jgi:diacylglycerol O-acyltransferase
MTSRPPSQPLTAADSAWLRMEDPTNLMTVTGVLMVAGGLDLDRVQDLLTERLLVHPRFRQRVVESPGRIGRPHWHVDDAFRIEDHIHRHRLPPPADEGALQAFVGEVMSTPLDYGRPLWHVYVVENAPAGTALVVRLHHAMGDGIALVRLLLSLTSTDPEGTIPGDFQIPEGGNPLRRGLWGLAAATGSVVGSLTKLAGVAILGDPPTALKGALGTVKRATWSARIPLAEVKRVGKALGGTVNDVLLTAVAGGLCQYLEGHHGVAHNLSLRAVVPVNVRRADEPLTLGNRFGLAFLPLPIGVRDRAGRLRELRRRMDEIKRSGEGAVTYGILRLLGATSAALEMAVVNILGRNSTAVMTSVPGPRSPLYLCGAKVEDVVFWVPQSGRLALGVSILSYAGDVRIGVATDLGVIPEPDALVRAFEIAFAELAADAGPG